MTKPIKLTSKQVGKDTCLEDKVTGSVFNKTKSALISPAFGGFDENGQTVKHQMSEIEKQVINNL